MCSCHQFQVVVVIKLLRYVLHSTNHPFNHRKSLMLQDWSLKWPSLLHTILIPNAIIVLTPNAIIIPSLLHINTYCHNKSACASLSGIAWVKTNLSTKAENYSYIKNRVGIACMTDKECTQHNMILWSNCRSQSLQWYGVQWSGKGINLAKCVPSSTWGNTPTTSIIRVWP
jgi:hypothetical protein